MKIKDIRASLHGFSITIPLLEGRVRGYGREEQTHFVFCEVETDEGHVGFGLTGHFLAKSVIAALHEHVLPTVKDMDPRDLEAIHQNVWKRLNPRAMTGTVSMALSCLDIALWDIIGKAEGRSIAALLGNARQKVPAYCTFGFPQYDRDHVDLMIDANYLFNPVEAKYLCRAIEDLNLTWFEEPLQQNDARALADLRRATKIPLAAGQMEGHRWRLREFVEHQAVDILQPNVTYCGGYTEARKVAHLAQIYNLPIANGGGWPLFNMHLLAGMMNGWIVEWHLGMVAVGETLFPDAPKPENGWLAIPDRPGLGLTLDRDAWRDTRVDG